MWMSEDLGSQRISFPSRHFTLFRGRIWVPHRLLTCFHDPIDSIGYHNPDNQVLNKNSSQLLKVVHPFLSGHQQLDESWKSTLGTTSPFFPLLICLYLAFDVSFSHLALPQKKSLLADFGTKIGYDPRSKRSFTLRRCIAKSNWLEGNH